MTDEYRSVPCRRIASMTCDELIEFILCVCEAQDGLCMDVPSERRRLARAIVGALYQRR